MPTSYDDESVLLLEALAAYADEPETFVERNGQWIGDFQGIRFTFTFEPEPAALLIRARVGTAGALDLEELLRANHLWGGTADGIFGLSPEDDSVYYFRRLSFPLADEPVYPEFLCDLMAEIVGAVEAAGNPAGDELPPPDAARPPLWNPAGAV